MMLWTAAALREGELSHIEPLIGAHALTNIEHKIELAGEIFASVRYSHQQLAPEESITEVCRLVGKIELRG